MFDGNIYSVILVLSSFSLTIGIYNEASYCKTNYTLVLSWALRDGFDYPVFSLFRLFCDILRYFFFCLFVSVKIGLCTAGSIRSRRSNECAV